MNSKPEEYAKRKQEEAAAAAALRGRKKRGGQNKAEPAIEKKVGVFKIDVQLFEFEIIN